MNSGQRKTLAAIFATPIPKNLIWADIESLFIALGCELCEQPKGYTAEASAASGGYSEAEQHEDREFKEGAPSPTRNDHVRGAGKIG